MRVILLQDVPKVGRKYEVKKVKDGFARNFLLPKNLAQTATSQAIKQIEIQQKQEIQKKELEHKLLLGTLTDLKDRVISYKTRVGEKGQLFDKIDPGDIREILKKETKIEIPKDHIKLEEPIKKAGQYEIELIIDKKKIKFKLNIESK
jgi:large subunit ribosomal protein L9